MTTKKVFISHSSQDKAAAQKICALLEASGVPCWIAPRDIPPGGEYQIELLNGIERSEGMAVLVSKSSIESPFVRNEVERAFSKKKKLYPVYLENLALSPNLEFFLSSRQSVFAWDGRLEDRVAELAQAVLERPVSPPPSAPAPKRSFRPAIVGALVLLLVSAGAGLFLHRNAPVADERGSPDANVSVAKKAPLNYHALVIGINTYDAHGGDGWDSLKTARQDAEAVGALLEQEYGFTVHRLLDGDATAKGMMVALDKLSRLTADDAMLIFYAGHGFYDKEQGEGYWIPTDARKLADGRHVKEDWLWNSVISKIVDASPARHVLIVADACYGGSLFRGDGDAPKTLDQYWYSRASAKPSRYLITSGDVEPVLDGVGSNSIFTRELLNFLRGNDSPLLSASEIGPGIRKKVAQVTGQMVRSGPLHVSSDAGGEFVFARRGAALPPVADEPATTNLATAVASRDDRLSDALALAKQGATNSAQKILNSIASPGGTDQLVQAVAGYLDRNQSQQRSDNLQSLIETLEKNKASATNEAGRSYADFARPRIMACLGPQLKGSGDPARAALYQLSLRTGLENAGGARVVEREHLEKILEEMNIGSSALADERASSTVGKLLPASLLLLGDLIPGAGTDSLYLRIVDTETTLVIASFNAERKDGMSVSETCAPLVAEITATMLEARPLKAKVFERDGTTLVAGLGEFHGAREGQSLDIVLRRIRTVNGMEDFLERVVGQGTIVGLGDIASDVAPVWNAEAAPADAILWVKERAP